MSKRFGKARVPGCECTYHYTCGPCLRDVGPYYFTSNPPAYTYQRIKELENKKKKPDSN